VRAALLIPFFWGCLGGAPELPAHAGPDDERAQAVGHDSIALARISADGPARLLETRRPQPVPFGKLRLVALAADVASTAPRIAALVANDHPAGTGCQLLALASPRAARAPPVA
jgi:hypothetical protein